MNLRDRPLAIWAFPLVMLVAALLFLGSDVGGMATRLRETLFDAYQRFQPRPYQDTLPRAGFSVRVLDSDTPNLKRLGPWPWPHSTLAKLTRELKAKGAALVVFAFPLDVPDPLSPKNLLAQAPFGPAGDPIRAALIGMTSPDDDLTAAMSQLATVTGFTLGGVNAARAPTTKARVTFVGTKNPFALAPGFDGASGAIEAVERTSLGTGALNLVFDTDGKLRRIPLVFRLNGRPVTALTAEILRVIEHKPRFVVRSDEGENGLFGAQPGIASFEALNLDLPTTPDGSMWIAFSGRHAERDVSAAALDRNDASTKRLANAIVILGPPGETIGTPVGARSVAEIYAESLENVLTGTPLRRPASAIEAELLCLAIFGVASIVLFTRFGVAWSGLFTFVSVAAAGAVSWHLYAANHVLFDALGPGIALVLLFGAAAIARGIEVRRARGRVRAAFAESLPPHAIEQIARKPELLSLDGVSRTVTYLACGVRSFGALADSFKDDPAAFTRLMQRVLVPLMDVVLTRGGTIDRLTVDGFTAFWNAPLDDPEHAVHACEAASAMSQAVARINDVITHERRNDGVAFTPVEIGVGVSTSPAIAGGVSAHGRTAYSVTGDCAVVANRIQQLSAQYGPAIIVADDTRKAAERGFAFLEVDYIAAGAHEEPLKLYAMLGSPVMRASPKFRALLTFHDHIFQSLRTQQWQKARELIEQCRKLSGASQKLYDLHLARIAYFEGNPPGSEWDGAFRPILK
ncbi:MAG: CHASE2 domain-containing protein [Rhizomicrobium sp.]